MIEWRLRRYLAEFEKDLFEKGERDTKNKNAKLEEWIRTKIQGMSFFKVS
jgi:hypothetical protein